MLLRIEATGLAPAWCRRPTIVRSGCLNLVVMSYAVYEELTASRPSFMEKIAMSGIEDIDPDILLPYRTPGAAQFDRLISSKRRRSGATPRRIDPGQGLAR